MASLAVDNSRHSQPDAGKASRRERSSREDDTRNADDDAATSQASGGASGFLMALLTQMFGGGVEAERLTNATPADVTRNPAGQGVDELAMLKLAESLRRGGPAGNGDDVAVRDWASQSGFARGLAAGADFSVTVEADVSLPALAAEGAKALVSAGAVAASNGEAVAAAVGVQAYGAVTAGGTPAAQGAGGVGAGGADARLAVDVNDVADQIATAAANAASRARVLVIRLDPPHLGEVRLTMWSSGSAVEGRLEVAASHTAAALRGETAALMGRLAEAGVAMRQLEITTRESGGSDGETNRDGTFRSDGQPSGQPGGGRGQGQDGPAGPHGGHDEFAAGDNTERAATQSPSETVGVGVNVWM